MAVAKITDEQSAKQDDPIYSNGWTVSRVLRLKPSSAKRRAKGRTSTPCMSKNDVSTHWSFPDPPNVAVFTTKDVVARRSWIAWVFHDKEDGAWQFHPPHSQARDEDASVVALETIVTIDPTVVSLSDLPAGWCACRAAPHEPWRRMPKRRRRQH